MTARETMSSFKLGLSVLWSACWTALPLKMAFAMVFMAMGTIHLETKLGITFLMLLMTPVSVFAFFIISGLVGFHFGEGTGLPLLFLLSIPIDIWALNLVARTIFLEQLRLEPPASLGVSLWVRFAVAGAVYLPLLWVIETAVTDTARSITHSILEMEALKHMPVAERIGLEFTAWGSASLIALLALIYLGMMILGKLVQSRAASAQPAHGTYQQLIERWDLWRVPKDQGLMLGAFTGAGAVLSVLFWTVLPISTPHPHDCCKPEVAKVVPAFDAQKSLSRDEKALKEAEVKIVSIEQRAAEEEKDKEKGKGGKDKAGVKDAVKQDGKAPAPSAGKAAGSGK